MGNNANSVLGRFWTRRVGQLWAWRNKDLHTLLGNVDVWLLLGHKHCCAVEFAHSDDESFISTDISKKNIYFFLLLVYLCFASTQLFGQTNRTINNTLLFSWLIQGEQGRVWGSQRFIGILKSSVFDFTANSGQTLLLTLKNVNFIPFFSFWIFFISANFASNHYFEKERADIEWKFARSKLWIRQVETRKYNIFCALTSYLNLPQSASSKKEPLRLPPSISSPPQSRWCILQFGRKGNSLGQLKTSRRNIWRQFG